MELILTPQTKECYVTKHGIAVEAFEIECPSQKKVERYLDRMFKATKTDTLLLLGYRLVYIDEPFLCGNLEADGCTDLVAQIMVVSLYDSKGDLSYLTRHEAGHVVRYKMKNDPDAYHHDCEFWDKAEGPTLRGTGARHGYSTMLEELLGR